MGAATAHSVAPAFAMRDIQACTVNGFAPPTPFAEAPALTPAFTTNEAFFAWEDPFDLSLE